MVSPYIMGPKDADRMANRSCLIWVYTVCPDLFVKEKKEDEVFEEEKENFTKW